MNRTEAIQLRQQRAGIATQMAALAEAGLSTPEERERFDKMDAEQKALLDRITRIEAATGLSAELSATGAPPNGQPGNDEPKADAEKREKAHRAAFKAYLKHGDGPRSPLTAEQRALLQPSQEQMRELRALGVGEAAGGQTWVPTGFVNQLDEAMIWYGPMLNGGPRAPSILRTATGAPLPFPTEDDTANEGEQIDENPVSDTSEANPTMGAVTLNAFMFSSKLVKVPLQLLQDSAFDVESYLIRKFGQRLGRILNSKFTTGAGSTTPMGIVTAATLGHTAVGSATNDSSGGANTIGSDDLVSLEHSVDIAHRSAPAFMWHDTTLAHLKRLKDKQGRPLWLPGVSVGAPDTVLAYPYFVNNHMDQLQAATGNSPVQTKKTVLFGDLTKYLARLAGEVVVFRDESTFIRKAQIAFVAFRRADGNLIDAGSHPIKYMRNVT